MRKIRSQLFISLDGIVDRLEEWHFPYFSGEMGAAVDWSLSGSDTLLLGHRTYDSFAEAWPEIEKAGSDDPADVHFAKVLGEARKIVVSNQELEFTWRNSEQLKGDFAEAVAALKEEPGDNHVWVPGSISIVRQLLAAGLLDELHLLVHPIAVGDGLRLFDGELIVPLRLVSSETFKNGVLNVLYEPENSGRETT